MQFNLDCCVIVILLARKGLLLVKMNSTTLKIANLAKINLRMIRLLFVAGIWIGLLGPLFSQPIIEGYGLDWTPISTDSTYIKRHLQRVFDRYPIPAMGVAIIHSDTIKAAIARGNNRFPDGGEITERNYFHLGSNSAVVASWIAARMVQKGEIEWNSRFFNLLPQYKKKANALHYDVTLEALLTHSAGILPFASAKEFDILSSYKGSLKKRRQKFVQRLFQDTPLGSVTYSNAGICMAVLMLEKASGLSYSQLLQKYIGKELGLNYFIGFPSQKSKEEVWGHWYNNPEDTAFTALKPGSYILPELLDPAMNLSMPFADYAFFIQFTLYGLMGKHEGFPKAMFEKICTEGKDNMAMSWRFQQDGNIRTISNVGLSGFSTITVSLFPEIDLAVIIASNTFGGPTRQVIEWLQEAVFSKLFELPPPPEEF